MAGEDLAELLALERTDDDRFRAVLNDENFAGEIFGGQYLGQSLWAAMATAQGRTFAHRRVTALQDGREVFRAEVSLHDPAEGEPEHQRRMPDAPDPEGLRSLSAMALIMLDQ